MAGAAILGCLGPELGRDEAAFFREAQPWGFFLFARNVETPAQLARLTASLREAVGRDCAIFTDQEGGRVQRMRAPHWREWLPPLDAAAGAPPGQSARALWLRARLIAHELRAVGIDGNATPCADIASPETHPFLRNRCYGETLAEVVAGARASAEGLLAGGVIPVMKHMPGHGRAVADSHEALPHVTAAPDDLRATDFAAFRALADLPAGMTGHMVFDALDPRPTTLSPVILRLIREEIGFGGLLMSDDLGMGALQGALAARAAGAVAAGCDLALYCKAEPEDSAAVMAAVPALSGAALARAEAALASRRAPDPLDVAAAEAELSAMYAGHAPAFTNG